MVVVEVTATSLYCVLFLPFLSRQVCLFLLFIFFLSSLWARIFLKITYKAVLTFLVLYYFFFATIQTHIFYILLFIWIRTQPYDFLPKSNSFNIFLFLLFLSSSLSLNFYISSPFDILIFLMFFFSFLKKIQHF